MDTKEKIVKELRGVLKDSYINLEDDDGISGFVVSEKFNGMASTDRQKFIEQALHKAPELLTQEEQRRILIIAALAPIEFDAVGSRIRVHRIREMAGGKFDILVHGRLADAEYVRGALNNMNGVRTTEPKSDPGVEGILMHFCAKGTTDDPLTRDRILHVLKDDPYIEVVSDT